MVSIFYKAILSPEAFIVYKQDIYYYNDGILSNIIINFLLTWQYKSVLTFKIFILCIL